MQCWEYKVTKVDFLQELEDALNELGAEGWELVSVSAAGFVLVLKRPLE
jgi:hypothetical protein